MPEDWRTWDKRKTEKRGGQDQRSEEQPPAAAPPASSPGGAPSSNESLVDRAWRGFRSWPTWAQILAVVVLLGVVANLGSGGGETSSPSTESNDQAQEQPADAAEEPQGGYDQQTTESQGASPQPAKGKAKFRTSNVQWQALNESQVLLTFTAKNRGNAAGRPDCFIEVDARDLNDECFGECGAQELFRGRRKVPPGAAADVPYTFPIQGRAAPNVYDIAVPKRVGGHDKLDNGEN